MKVIVAGSRTINDYSIVKQAWIDSSFDITAVVSGGARGVDRCGEMLAEELGVSIYRFQPDWASFGKRAGIIRNTQMGDFADALVAVWDGASKGTAHMINYMKKLDKPVFVYDCKR